jgi:hypothetical protein
MRTAASLVRGGRTPAGSSPGAGLSPGRPPQQRERGARRSGERSHHQVTGSLQLSHNRERRCKLKTSRSKTVLRQLSLWGNAIRYSPLSVLRENVVAVLHQCVAREPALGVVFLRRFVRHGGGPKRIGRRVTLERAPYPSAAVREPLAVLHHEINVVLGTWHRWLTGVRLLFFGFQWIFAILAPSGKGSPLPGTPSL